MRVLIGETLDEFSKPAESRPRGVTDLNAVYRQCEREQKVAEVFDDRNRFLEMVTRLTLPAHLVDAEIASNYSSIREMKWFDLFPQELG